MPRTVPFVFPLTVRYLEVDQQGVVFNMWYLAYFDDAWTAFLEEGGLPYGEMLADGHDVQVVHTELDWHGPLGFGDPAEVRVGLGALGRSSITVQFEVWTGDRRVVSATTVYVVVPVGGQGSAPIPERLRASLGDPVPLR
ncbi:MAG TPA: thioesterase family protein [Acidimicrobiales bacterium]|nr:thioesterase family protein [Acidimicrobiales bacterium]